ncbi:DUF421 domain-containing protein [Hymenobacter busanensis]|uniref:DUF421 domain-containing protein n=1 Tax=Hymenobacter busanensis TaxID=2607656 RepID=A0A7L5A2U7_9BACT|nr:DUF421 domain-containing protein [Hymenobacter busanensis]KAA9338200.1 DUF421 domain-containing protein [Hymenobacter busanensis]QHJ09375.1 DUF421 domain-containing protein [Hymenobacter busanensis]
MPSESISPFDWQRLLWSDNMPPAFLGEVVFRCVVTYLLILGTLRITGRRQVKQLSLFELSIILALGSAAGDAMFYHDVPMLHVLAVFVVITALYWLFNHLTERFPRFSDWLEGKPVCLVQDGQIQLEALEKQNLTHKELFGELRQLQVEHLGQVRKLFFEATGEISVFFYPDDEPVRPGLPIWPDQLDQAQELPKEAGTYACDQCGYTTALRQGQVHACPRCRNGRWLPVCTARRVS